MNWISGLSDAISYPWALGWGLAKQAAPGDQYSERYPPAGPGRFATPSPGGGNNGAGAALVLVGVGVLVYWTVA